MKYKEGDKVKIKTWKQMADEYGLTTLGNVEGADSPIKDSGERTVFDTGAVRDMHTGKGRCDLLPLDVVQMVYDQYQELQETRGGDWDRGYFDMFDIFLTDQDEVELILIACRFIEDEFKSFEDAILEVAIHFEDGCNKYGENNWRKGIPEQCYMDSAIRHFLKYKAGWDDERHDRAFLWNILCLIWTHERRGEI